MAWIKRNLWFLIGGVVALGLLGVSSFYLYVQNKANNEVRDKLTEGYAGLNTLNTENPHPGNDKVDNIAAARKQRKEWQEAITKARTFFEPIAPIPAAGENTNGITDQEFASALRRTIDQMQHDAQASSVVLPPQYDFSFGAIKSKITFAPGSLDPLSVQLGEIKAIADILFRAKVNSLDGIKRSRVSQDDREAADYIDTPSVTNDLAVITPYEVDFRCFSTELAGVFSGFANSTHCFVVKTVAVEPAGTASGGPAGPGAGPDASAAPAAPAAPTVVLGRGGLPTVLNEHPLKVTMLVDLVKLKSPGK
jgi:hypothetical protein